jgi:tetratricopeptide (TPR) repeat protein
MNRLKTKIVALVAILVCLFSCNPADKKAGIIDYSKILNTPPYDKLTDSIIRFPGNAELHHRRAMMLSQNKLHKLATPDYEKAWDITKDENIALEYATNLLVSGNVAKAIRFLEDCAEKIPGNSEFNRRLAEIYMQNGDNDKALREYDNIIARDSSNFEAWYDKGILLARLRDTTRAISSLETSFSLVPINYSGIALANIYVARKDPRALDICNILLSRDSGKTQTEPLFMKGVYYSDVKDYDNAIKQFDECIKRDWKMTDAYIEKGILLFEMAQFDKALKVFSMAATVSNTDADAYYWMGRCYEATGKKEEAIINYQRALALDNSFTEARAALRRLNS